MKRSEVRELVYKGIKALGNQIKFNSGRVSEFNKEQKEYPYIWLESLKSSSNIVQQGANIDDWDIVLHIAKKDQPDSIQDQYELIVDDCDYIAQQLIKQYADLLDDAKLVTFDSADRDPFIHKHADDTTGVILTMTWAIPDTTDVC